MKWKYIYWGNFYLMITGLPDKELDTALFYHRNFQCMFCQNTPLGSHYDTRITNTWDFFFDPVGETFSEVALTATLGK